MHDYLHKDDIEEFDYDINHLLHAASVLCSYSFVLPTILWVTTQCMNMQALQLAEKNNNPDNLGQAWRVLGRVASESDTAIHINGEGFNASACFENSLAIFQAAEISQYPLDILSLGMAP